MTKEQEFRKLTEEAKFKAFSVMCKKTVDLEQEKCELLGIIQQKDELIEKLICCGNCKHYLRDCQYSIICLNNNYKDWEVEE